MAGSGVDRPVRRGAAVDVRVRAAALQVLRDDGYRTLTMEGVAAAAGVAKTSVYRRFPTKAALVGAVLTELVTGAAPDAADPVQPSGDLLAVARRVAAAVAEPAVAQAVLGVLLDAGDEEVAAARAALLAHRPGGGDDPGADAVGGAVLLRALVLRLPVDEDYLLALVARVGDRPTTGGAAT